MKCPKCGYLGFETSDRCRNCGYDFSLTVDLSPATELPLHSAEGAGAPLADFDLSESDVGARNDAGSLDLDRLIGTPEPEFSPTHRSRSRATAPDAPEALEAPDALGSRRARHAPRAGDTRANATAGKSRRAGLPFDGDDDTPLITAPRPARPPLSVRRTTPEIPRVRARTTTPRPDELELFEAEPVGPDSFVDAEAPGASPTPPAVHAEQAGLAARAIAALIDVVLLGAINVAVLYLTLAMTGLGRDEIGTLPLAPLVLFFVILDGGYLVAFIAASGQTIGKMLTHIRVIRDDGQRVDIAGAVLRAVGCGLSLLTAGLGYLPAFLTTDGRALQDRISRTRVVSAR
jgi:uncharacterized RDD family membrane protein YckC